MSQSGTRSSGGGGTIVSVSATSDSTNTAEGIYATTVANAATVILSNRVTGTGSTVGATTADLITFALGATPGVFTLETSVSGFETTTPAGCGYNIFGTVRTTGAAATLVGTPDKIVNEEAALTLCDVNMVVSGNNVIIRATGTVGLTSGWNAVGYYVLRT